LSGSIRADPCSRTSTARPRPTRPPRTVKIGASGTPARLARRHACEEWLRGYPAGGPRPAKECEQAAIAAVFDRMLLERARGSLAIRSIRTGFGKGSRCDLSLPEPDGGPGDGPNEGVAVHTPQFVTGVSRAEYEGV
jgi:hypothetical protein